MADRQDTAAKARRNEDLFFTGLKKRPVSPLNNRVWTYVLLIAAGCLLAWMLIRLVPAETGIPKLLVLAAVLLATWALAVRMLFIQTGARLFWVIWLLIGIIPLASSRLTVQGWIGASFFSFVFLLVRKYRPYESLTSRRQAYVFGLGLILLPMLLFFWPPRPDLTGAVSATPAQTAASVQAAPVQVRSDGEALLNNVLRFSLVSLRWFWFFSLFHLLVTVRLHFMKLRPKLAVAAFFLVIVPIVLLFALGAGTLYVILGQSHAAGARNFLLEWSRLAAADRDFVKTLSPDWFEAAASGQGFESSGRVPGWLQELSDGLRQPGSPLGPKDSASGFFFGASHGLWLIGSSGPLAGAPSFHGCPVDEAVLSKLAGIMRSDIVLGMDWARSFIRFDEAKEGEIRPPADKAPAKPKREAAEVRAVYRPDAAVAPPARPRAGESVSFLDQHIYFGAAALDVWTLEKDGWTRSRLVLQTPRSLRTTLRELFAASTPMSGVVLTALAASVFLFLVLETLALVFGLRISGGITKGIRTLHRHLDRVSEGDLDTAVEIPNQDELGDLAFSFNQMTAAVKQGREEAVARERLEKELETARAIQERLLPHKMPILPGFEVSGVSLPSHEVGGDYFDFLDLPTGHLGVAVADVSGKGIPAALLMANLQASLRAQDLKPERIAAVASRLNGLLVQNTDERMFVTFFCGILDRMTASFAYTNAGHNPPMLVKANGKLLRLEEGGMLLGFLADQPYVQSSVSLESGDVLVLFTDGITEAVNPEADSRETKYFGEEKLVEVLRANAGRPAADIQASVLAAVSAHAHQAPPGDDMTLVVIKRTGGQEATAYVS